jgi:hypothetical protein
MMQEAIMLNKIRIPMLATIMAVYLSLFMISPALAGLVPSIPSTGNMAQDGRAEEINRIQNALESKILAEKLRAYGLSAEDVKEKLKSMSDDQIHTLAQASDRVLAGGDGLGFVIGILIIVLLVVVIMKVLDKKIIIK